MRYILIIIILLLSLLSSGKILVAENKDGKAQVTAFKVGSVEYISGAKKYVMDVAPFVDKGKIFVPVRFLMYSLGIEEITWDETLRMIKIRDKKGHYVEIYLKEKVLKTNENVHRLETVPKIKNGRVFLPAGHIVRYFGYEASWDNTQKQLVIYEKINRKESEKGNEKESSTLKGETVKSLRELKECIKSHIYNRESFLTVKYSGDTDEFKKELLNILNEVLWEDDYVYNTFKSCRCEYSGYANDTTIKFNFKYLTTCQQEAFVTQRVKEIINKIITPDMDEFEKVKVIHDFIIINTAYDGGLKLSSAYSALNEKKATCLGYALLAYKMFIESGIESRIVRGETKGGKHAWNMVKLKGNWYHIDLTWNDPLPDDPGRVLYRYYNLTDAEISKTHKWDKDKYPTAQVPYDPT